MKKILKDIFSSSDGISSKRVFGAIGFIFSIIYIGIWQRELTDLLLVTSASMIGLETITNIFLPKNKI
jgi:hypothetical protein